MKKVSFAVALGLAMLSCAKTPPDTLPGVRVLTGKAATGVLRQCSREVPKHDPTYWQPSALQIQTMERRLPAALRKLVPEGDWHDFPEKWGRRYVGITRGGKRFVYGDYFPAGMGDVCDGGTRFFGAEYDPDSGMITQLATNGVV